MNTTHIHHIRHVANLHVHFATPPAPGELLLSELITGEPIAPPTGTPAPAPMAAAAASTPPGTLTPPAPGTAWPGQGGIYIGTLPAQFGLPARHLIASAQECEDIKWGGYNHDTTGATSQTDGRANTAALLADSEAHPAARWASEYKADGHADFYLPSRHELFMAWLLAPQAFHKSDWYWSSSQYSRGSAWIQDFSGGGSYALGKDNEFRARAVRTIPLL